jgi:hypothetical protein
MKEATVKSGSSSDVSPPDELRALEQGYPGDGPDLDTAFRNAWERGKAASGRRVYRVQDIFIWGENPISGYRVILTPAG